MARKKTRAVQQQYGPGVSDSFLRGFGFAIASREEGREARWRRNGREYLQSVAETIAIAELEAIRLKIEIP